MYSYNIDEIMDMLDWNNNIDIQKKGIKLGGKIRCINVFLQPRHSGHGKNVWENCAKILYQKSDEELSGYILDLFEWLQDANWPGFFVIYDRLKKMQSDLILSNYIYVVKVAQKTKNKNWLDYLAGLIENSQIYEGLSSKYKILMKIHYRNFWKYQK